MVVVTYHCPRCEALAELERDAYLADKCVTPDPLDGWEYAAPWEDYEDSVERSSTGRSDGRRPYEEAEGVEIVCGAAETQGEGCGRPYYLSFVKFEAGEELEPHTSVVDANFDFLRR